MFGAHIPDSRYAFAHAKGRKAGEPVQDVKNAFQTALETAGIENFTEHDLRDTFPSWLIMKGRRSERSPSCSATRVCRW